MMENGSTAYEWQFDDFGIDVTADDDDMSMDIDSLLSILEESNRADSSQNGLVDPSLSIAPCTEPTSQIGVVDHFRTNNGSLEFSPSDQSGASVSGTVCSYGSFDSGTQMVNYGFTKVEPRDNVAPPTNFPSGIPSDWPMPVPGYDSSQDFSSFNQYDTRETRANSSATFGFSGDNGNHQPMDAYCDSVSEYCRTSEAPENVEPAFVDISRYSDIVFDPNDALCIPYFVSKNEPSYLVPPIDNGGMNPMPNSSLSSPTSLMDQNSAIGHQSFEVVDDARSKNSFSGHTTCLDDDDICILEDMSKLAPKKQSPVIISQRSQLGAPPTQTGFSNTRLKMNDERFIYRVALQDLSQPKSEASPPDRSLAVPLLRHQRIALSWMVQKETRSMHCFGGILADDQGLGKTISTIALILKERSPPSSVGTIETKKKEADTLNLDDDEDDYDSDKRTRNLESCATATSRLAAGTLVVCPTSVLRQWNDELHNKVSTESKLSVLVYHGGNRTKDPSELAKYDVVLTTYAIVSMEVPKQPLVDEDDGVGLSSTKKRKYPPTSGKSSKKENKLFESLARPLAKVRWFRVVLDEAQSIKNHRTQVARACWGLRAKRRWCLSGTPIQNAVDDLYSYFRFLKYDPYAVYKSFCSTIKVPIQRNPVNGYRKLQAVLKTIMLRRTKGTLLDGEPIISLPPKTVNLTKVDFSAQEREFYCRLEAESRAQFAEYAAAGTVKQNYVNILLMLLRLRQACDHPLLVRGCRSDSEWKSSIEKEKKLSPEKRNRLLNCLEASLAICGICNDPPEDAVVTTCEHVFCNQCILEHLSSDDCQCPSLKCKALIGISSVFSSSALGVSIGGGLVKSEALEPCLLNRLVGSSKTEAAEACDSAKIKAAIDALQSIAKPRETITEKPWKDTIIVREKAIVFSQWTRMLDLLEVCLKDSSIGYRRLDGTMSVVARDKAVKDFNTLPEVTVIIMSLKAASLGLNMVAACHVLLLDLWWNPTTEDQAIDRAHRIGQTRPVTVLRLTVRNTVEDRILALQQKKREMVSSAFGEDESGSRQTRLTVDDLKYLFQG